MTLSENLKKDLKMIGGIFFFNLNIFFQYYASTEAAGYRFSLRDYFT
jgi:hypothetical protein